MTIFILFHSSGFRCFKHFYQAIPLFYPRCFPDLLAYNRFVELMPRSILALCAFLNTRLGGPTGMSFIDSTCLSVCKSKRMSRNRVFKSFAAIGKSTIGWLLDLNYTYSLMTEGKLLSVLLTQGNVDDRHPVIGMTKRISRKLFGDKGYISGALNDKLLEQGLTLITGIRKSMKNKLIHMIDKILLHKRSVIETINDQLNNISQVEHSRHRSITGFLVNLFGGLITYTFNPEKPSIKHVFIDQKSSEIVLA